jgi:hypothetical protein
MADYISREAFIASCEGRYCAPCKEQGEDANGVRCRACWVDDMLSEVLDAPAADVDPVRHGRWVNMGGFPACSECGCSPAVCEPKPNNPQGFPEWCYGCGCKIDLEGENE